jgi:hypothetical protein
MKRIGPFIICLGALVFFLASKEQKTQFKEKEVQKTSFQLSSQERPDYSWWEKERTKRQFKVNQYIKKNKKNYEWFQSYSIGLAGVPTIMFKVFPDVFPDIWGKNWVEEVGLWRRPASEKIDLPHGVTWGKVDRPIVNLPLLNKLRIMVVNLTCSSCHTGRVIGPQGKTHILIGAPNITFDPNRWQEMFFQSALDKRWKAENFLKAVKKLRIGRLYKNKKYAPQELLDRAAFMKETDLILNLVKEGLNFRRKRLRNILAPRYGEIAHLLKGGLPGALEAFATMVALVLPEEKIGDKAFVNSHFGPGPAMVDSTSVWMQDDRPLGQWDGILKHPLFRNLGAEVGLVADPKLVNYKNAHYTVKFLSKLPPPPYPFKIDKRKADRGEVIYKRACQKCHAITKFVPLKIIKTDRYRALSLTSAGLKIVAKNLKIACQVGKEYNCDLPDDEIVIDRTKNPGYIAMPHDGLWARAPYLHNGSIPTLYHLLVPSERPSTYRRANIHYDTKKVGFEWRKGGKATFKTQFKGFSNRGHEDRNIFFGGIDFKKESGKREDLLEYLKSL